MTDTVASYAAQVLNQVQARARLLDVLDTPLPAEPYSDIASKQLVLYEDDWAAIHALQRAFGLPARRDLNWVQVQELRAYLTENIGPRIHVYRIDQDLFRFRYRNDDPMQLAYIKALCMADTEQVAQCVRALPALSAFR